jgi:hypothetical protein
MKYMVAMLMAAALMACGSKAKKNTTPTNTTGGTEMKTDGATGGQTYGGTATTPAPAGGGADPCAGQ